MEIIEYTFEKNRIEDYTNLLETLYKKDFRIQLHKDNICRLLDKKNPFFANGKIRNFIAKEKDTVLGHCSAMIDSRNIGVGLIGFYDCVNDKKVSDKLLDKCITWLKEKGCQKIRGPINLTIWHDYRFISKCKTKPLIFDPFCKDYYASFWQKKGFVVAGKYISAERKDLNFVISPTKNAYEKTLKTGFSIRKYNKNSDDLHGILDLANKIFSESWNFVPLTYEEFGYLYQKIIRDADSILIEIAEDKFGKMVGFSFSLPNPFKKEQMILKTIGVLPELRRQNIAAALLYSVHLWAKTQGFKEFYYPLIRVGNNVTKFPYEGYEITTEYNVFELSLN